MRKTGEENRGTSPIVLRPRLFCVPDCSALQLVDRLKEAGVAPDQAAAVVRVISAAQEELLIRTHPDPTLERILAPIRTDLTVLKWMMAVLLVGVVLLIFRGSA